MTDDLKPCPFCGETPTQQNAQGSWVYCHGCGTDGPYVPDPIAAWNTRTDTATWNAAIHKAAAIAHSGVEAYGAKMRAATDKKEKRDWQSMLMAAVDVEHAILTLLKEKRNDRRRTVLPTASCWAIR